MCVCEAYDKEKLEEDERIVMHLHPAIAPCKAAVLPLTKKLSEDALKLFDDLSKEFVCEYDEAGSIGKRYRRNDAIGTPFCITYDFDSLNDKCVTVRADTGAMGGSLSEEFQAITDIGEDTLVLCDKCDYSSNLEIATNYKEEEKEKWKSLSRNS